MIHISGEQMGVIVADAEKCYPNECCGILYGEAQGNGVKRVEQISVISNAREEHERYHRFEITPQMMLEAEIYARRNRLDIVGFYHSHPDCPAVPSEYDRTHALPVYSYIIASVIRGQKRDVKSWELSAEDLHFYSEQIDYDHREEG